MTANADLIITSGLFWGAVIIFVFAVVAAKVAGLPGFFGGAAIGFFVSTASGLTDVSWFFMFVLGIILVLAFLVAGKMTNIGGD